MANVLYLKRIKQFYPLASQYVSSKIILIMEVERRFVNKSTRRRKALEMFYIALATIDQADLWDSSWSFIWRTLFGNSRRYRSVQFSGFLVHELPLWKRMRDEETRKRNMLSRREEGIASPSTACSRIHVCTYQYRPCMTRRLTGHADKNEEKLLSYSNRAILDPSLIPRQNRACFYFVYKLKRIFHFKEIMTRTTNNVFH